MIAVLDANVAIALLLNLPYSESARRATASATVALAPDLLLHETTNALWRMGSAGHLDGAHCREILERIPLLFDEIVSSAGLVQKALDLALGLKHPAYDCFYVALAVERNTTLITADRKLATVVQAKSRHPPVILVDQDPPQLK